MNLSDSGTFSVRAYSAAEAEPIPGAIVRIKGAEEDNRFVFYSLVTDSDGITKAVALPAPSVNYSLAPGAKASPYSVYDIEITKDGFYTKHFFNVAVFSGVNSVLPINMIPYGEDTLPSSFPHGNLNVFVTENPTLE
jgi:hypothetical protein